MITIELDKSKSFAKSLLLGSQNWHLAKVGIPNFVSGPREYIMEGEYVILAMCSWFRIR